MYAIKLDDFYVKITDTDNVEYVQGVENATHFDSLSELSEKVEYCHIAGCDVVKV